MLFTALFIVTALATAEPDTCRRTTELSILTSLGHRIHALRESPAHGEGPFPTVVLVGGSGPEDHDAGTLKNAVDHNHAMRVLAHDLVRRGYAVVRFDEMGVGRSTGDYAREATTATLTTDVVSIVRFVGSDSTVRSDRVIVVGYSEGASIALLAAARESRVSAVIGLSTPAWRGERVIERQHALWLARAGRPGEPHYEDYKRELEAEQLARANEPWYRSFRSYAPMDSGKLVRAPVLLLHGRLDDYVETSQPTELRDSLLARGNADVSLIIFDRLEHTLAFGPTMLAPLAPEVMSAIGDWLTTRFRPLPCVGGSRAPTVTSPPSVPPIRGRMMESDRQRAESTAGDADHTHATAPSDQLHAALLPLEGVLGRTVARLTSLSIEATLIGPGIRNTPVLVRAPANGSRVELLDLSTPPFRDAP